MKKTLKNQIERLNKLHIFTVIYKNYVIDKKRSIMVLFSLLAPILCILGIFILMPHQQMSTCKEEIETLQNQKRMNTTLQVPVIQFDNLVAPVYIYPCNLNHEFNDRQNLFQKSATLAKIYSFSFSGSWWEYNSNMFNEKWFKFLPKFF